MKVSKVFPDRVLVVLLALDKVLGSSSEAFSEGIKFLTSFDQDPFTEGSWAKSKKSQYETQEVKVRTLRIGSLESTELELVTPNSFYGVSAAFPEAISNVDGKDLVIQYDVTFPERHSCGGAYLKFLREPFDKDSMDSLSNDTPYSIMFGPDKCGKTDKVHFILQHLNPKTNEWEEKHLKNTPRTKSDTLPHLYTLLLSASTGTYEIFIDMESESKGILLDSMLPPIQPPRMIVDPDDKKPDDWVDSSMIPDPDAVKPDEWDEEAPIAITDPDAVKPEGWLDDEPLMIPDPDFEKPDLWDDEEDGQFVPPLIENPACFEAPGCGTWSPPLIANPAYKGKWTPPMIQNPNYKGPYVPREIPNPHFFEVEKPAEVSPMTGVAIEIWTTLGGIRFDNILVANNLTEAFTYSKKTWEPKNAAQKKLLEMQQEAQAIEESHQYQRNLLEEGGVMNTIEASLLMVKDWFLVHYRETIRDPTAAAGTLLAMLIGVVALVFIVVGREKKPPTPAAAAAPRTEEKSNEDSSSPSGQTPDVASNDREGKESVEAKENK